MKQYVFPIVVFLCLVSCAKETGTDPPPPLNPCASITCQNGGTCANGTCNCPPGYGGAQCQTLLDPCENLNCQNGGNCVNGSCNCPFPYAGETCAYLQYPSDIRIAEIRLLHYPLTNHVGQYWVGTNANNRPDIRPRISTSDFNQTLAEGALVVDADPNQTHTWVISPARSIVYFWSTSEIAPPYIQMWNEVPNDGAYRIFEGWMKRSTEYPTGVLPITSDGKQTHTMISQNGLWKFEFVLQYVW
jgi:hypothetical protein